jgi:glycosyltransferase involved in cell wall biosynthesis
MNWNGPVKTSFTKGEVLPVRQDLASGGMKVLHVSESLIGGPASYLEEILPYQVEQFGRDNVILLAPREHRDYITGRFTGITETYPRPGRTPRALLALGFSLWRAIRRHRPDIVHLHSSFAGAIGRTVLLTVWPRPLVAYCAHCWSFDRMPRSPISHVWQWTEWCLSHLTDKIVNISPHEQELLSRTGFPLNKVALIVTGVGDLEASAVAPPSLRRFGAPLRLLFIGRLDPQKGADLLLREWSDIDPARATLSLVGGKVRVSADLTIPPLVRSSGWVPRTAIVELIRDHDAVLMPSRWEGMPIAAIEVLRAGRPLLASNHGAFPHFIVDGVNGVLMDIDRPGFVDRALRVLEGADLATMGVAARATYEVSFQQLRMNRDLERLYRGMLDAAAGAQRPQGSPVAAPASSARRTGPVWSTERSPDR